MRESLSSDDSDGCLVAHQHQIPRWGCDSKIVDILLERDFEAFVRFEHVAISKMTGFVWL